MWQCASPTPQPPTKLPTYKYLQTAVHFSELSKGTNYQAPQPTDLKSTKACFCNTVFYSLIAACSLCQYYSSGVPLRYALSKSPKSQPTNHGRRCCASWPFWSQNCDKVYIAQSVRGWGWATHRKIGGPIIASCLPRFPCPSLVVYHHVQVPLHNPFQHFNTTLGVYRLGRKCARPIDVSRASRARYRPGSYSTQQSRKRSEVIQRPVPLPCHLASTPGVLRTAKLSKQEVCVDHSPDTLGVGLSDVHETI